MWNLYDKLNKFDSAEIIKGNDVISPSNNYLLSQTNAISFAVYKKRNSLSQSHN